MKKGLELNGQIDLHLRRYELLCALEKKHCEDSLAQFVKSAWHIIEPGTKLVWNWHLDVVCAYLEAFHHGKLPAPRLILNIPPGTMKSIIVSVAYPAWVWISKPQERIMTVSNEQGLAIRDALRMKLVVTSDWYQSNWPLKLKSDQNEKTLYANEKLGHRQAIGVTASVTGKRCGLLLLDDLVDAKQAFSDVIRQSVNDTWDQALTTRLNDPVESGVILIMQRLHCDDLTGHLLKKTKVKWTHLKIPMEYQGFASFDAMQDIGVDMPDPRSKKGELMFPARFTKSAVMQLKEDLGEYGYAGQMNQEPLPDGGGIIKKNLWRVWPDDMPMPRMLHIFHSWDTAFSERDSINAAYSACTRWGIFFDEQKDRYCIMCLGRWFDRLGYDELRAKVKEFGKKYSNDVDLIEKKATGISLIQDLKRAAPGRVRAYSPGKGEDKISRAHSVSPLFSAGLVYVPNKVWALGCKEKNINGLVDYVAMFPAGSPPVADLTDTVTCALIYMRSNRWIGDHPDDIESYYDKLNSRSDEAQEDEMAAFGRRRYYS